MVTNRLNRLLEGALKRAGIVHKIAAFQVLEECQSIILEWWGRQAFERIKPKHIKRGVLTIEVKDSIFLVELKLKEKEIINRINKKIKKTVIKGLRFLIN